MGINWRGKKANWRLFLAISTVFGQAKRQQNASGRTAGFRSIAHWWYADYHLSYSSFAGVRLFATGLIPRNRLSGGINSIANTNEDIGIYVRCLLEHI
jgi:hypothetical protein